MALTWSAACMAVAMTFACAGQAQAVGEPTARINRSGLSADDHYSRFIVVYRDGSAERRSAAAARQTMEAAAARAGLAGAAAGAARSTRSAAARPAVAAQHLRKLATGADLLRTSRALDGSEAQALVSQLSADPAVAYVVPDFRRRAVRERSATDVTPVVPDDTYYAGYQWHLREPDGSAEPEGSGSVANYGGADVAKAWTLADGSGITVAVLDTGITAHPDLDTSLADDGYDFISDAFVSGRASDGRAGGGWDPGDWTSESKYYTSVDPANGCVDPNDPDNPPEDSSWHGTHVSGTVAELTDNGQGMAGVAYKAKILPVRVLGHCGGYDSDINDAIVWAAGGHVEGVPDNTHPAQVINLSLGGSGACDASNPQAQAIAMANALGATVVVAAGNAGRDAANYAPASCPGAVTVAAVGISSRKAFYSNYGSRVDLAAPGGGIYANDASSGAVADTGFVWQALNSGAHEPAAPAYNGYAGTSQATPHVAGTVALLQSARLATAQPLLSPAEVLTVLKNKAHAFRVTPSATQKIGAGIVDAYAAVRAAIDNDLGGGGGDPQAPLALGNGEVVAALAGGRGDSRLFTLQVPSGVRALVLRTYGGSGNVSLYVRQGEPPSDTSFDRSSVHAGNNETISIARPAAGTYYLRVAGESAFSGVSVQGSYSL